MARATAVLQSRVREHALQSCNRGCLFLLIVSRKAGLQKQAFARDHNVEYRAACGPDIESFGRANGN
ncbi:MAG: hypothetical protein ABW175_25355 [Bradyrhizobium sp.]